MSRPDTRKIDEDRRLLWLFYVRRFKRGLQVRTKLGVLGIICQRVGEQLGTSDVWNRPDWTDDKWLTLLYTCVRDEQYPTELLEWLVRDTRGRLTMRGPILMIPTPEDVVLRTGHVLRSLSTVLQSKFNVFYEEKYAQAASEPAPSRG